MTTPDPFRAFSALSDIDPNSLLALAQMDAPPGTMLFDAGQPCAGFPLVLAGEVRVSRQSAEGRSLELYRVVEGEICLVSAASLFGHTPLSATGVATRETRIAMIPPPQFYAWLAEPNFRESVLGMFAERMADLTSLVDAIAFHRLDQRLAATLLGRGQVIDITHQALADELGTVREIVTRLLRRFERADMVELSREHIRIKDVAALRSLAT
jgi:CRP/FNR family transcriptional regulator, anaerobic regulatory protein